MAVYHIFTRMCSFQDHFIREITLIELSYSYYCFNGFVIFPINTFMHCIIFHIQFGKYCCSISLQGSICSLHSISLRCSHITSWNKFMNLSPRTCDLQIYHQARLHTPLQIASSSVFNITQYLSMWSQNST